jgi:homocysteine S-methyltransferase
VEAEMQWNGWPAQLFVPDSVEHVHKSYVDAGADVVTTNTYATNRHVMGIKHYDEEQGQTTVAVANAIGVRVARTAARSAKNRKVIVAGSISNHPPAIEAQAKATETSSLTAQGRWPAPEQEYQNYRESALALADAGADVLFLEMVKDTMHGDLLVRAANSTGLPVVIGLTLTVVKEEGGRLKVVARDEPEVTVEQLIEKWSVLENVVGYNAMHSSAPDTEHMVRAIRAKVGPKAFVGAYPNQGYWAPPDWVIERPLIPDAFRRLAETWVEAGCNAIGGCCGLGPEHISAVSALAREINSKAGSADQFVARSHL